VYYTTIDGTATAGTDYGYTSGTLTIPAGRVTAPQPIKIPILDDGNDESGGTQYFKVKLTGAEGATVVEPDTSIVDITESPQQQGKRIPGGVDYFAWP
jgi:hypothetical protein